MKIKHLFRTKSICEEDEEYYEDFWGRIIMEWDLGFVCLEGGSWNEMEWKRKWARQASVEV